MEEICPDCRQARTQKNHQLLGKGEVIMLSQDIYSGTSSKRFLPVTTVASPHCSQKEPDVAASVVLSPSRHRVCHDKEGTSIRQNQALCQVTLTPVDKYSYDPLLSFSYAIAHIDRINPIYCGHLYLYHYTANLYKCGSITSSVEGNSNSQNLETTKMSITEEWIKKMRYIYTMEYYSAEKNNNIMKFAGKQKELENIILSEVTQTQKDKHEKYCKTQQGHGKLTSNSDLGTDEDIDEEVLAEAPEELAHEALSESDKKGIGEKEARKEEANVKTNTKKSPLLKKNVQGALSA
ncbi:hypothetical protein STEG23_034746 [Scotinomys teguina]